MNTPRDFELNLTRRQLFGRGALGLGTAAMAQLMGTDLQAQGVDVLLVLFPYLSRKAYDDWDFRALHDRFAAEAERLGLPFLDLYDAFDRNGLVADRLNLHPTSAGHAVAGSELAAELRRRGSWKKTDSSRKKPPTER